MGKRDSSTHLVAFAFWASLLSGQAAAGNEDKGMVLGTLFNFVEYYQEAVSGINDNGGTGPITWPQWGYDPGLGPINALPEFSVDLGLNFTPFYLLDLPNIPFEYRFYINTPEAPAVKRKVVGITEDDGYTDPHIPPLRWSADGRIGVESQVGGTLESPAPISLYLMAPEKLNEPFVDSPNGPAAMVLDRFNIPFDKISGGRTGTVQHVNICDPYVRSEGDRKNPYSCGVNGEDDCYDVTLISGYVRLGNGETPKLDDGDRVLGTKLNIRVKNPKTPNAEIAEVTYGETQITPNRTGILFETITPADGRLLVARRGFLPLVWKNEANGETHVGSYDTVYGVAPPDAEPCDVSYWGDLYPITHAPYDERVNKRYGFAMQPFRDPTGAVIPDGVDIKGTYPWMDKEAKNFSVQVSGANLFPTYNYDKNPQSRYPVRCVSEDECSLEHQSDVDNSKDNMFVVMGAWTQGKMVLVDGKLNDIDFRLGSSDKNQSYLSLYKPKTGNNPDETGEVRVGAVRGGNISADVYDHQGQYLGRFDHGNLSMLDSIENRLNYLPNIKPSKFQDVVWNMSSGHSTVEFSFDDYLNPDGFIVSNMVTHMQHQSNNWYRMYLYDGWHQLTRSFNGQVRVQNSATALPERWAIPTHGRVYNGRMEPVANGGIRGKGMWFNGGSTRIDYKVENQPQSVYESDWFYSLFIDPRFDDDHRERVLIRFPDQSQMTIKGRSSVVLYNSRQTPIAEFTLPSTLPDKGWSQLALLVEAEKSDSDERSLTLFVNGFHHETWNGAPYINNIERNNFRPTKGTLRLGKGSIWGGKRAFKGWMDEFKVFAYEPDPETICNYAHGSLIGLPSGYQGKWWETASHYRSESHDYVSEELASYGKPVYSQYACYHDYSDDNKAHKFNIPEGVVSVRQAIHFPEGPLYFDAPRPDSTNNDFCLSCHQDSAVPGLRKDALTLNTLFNAKDDPRRQPTQPPAKVYGNVPANWFPGAPDVAFDAGYMGIDIDEWVLPSAVGVAPEIRNLALADTMGHPWKALNETDLNVDTLPININQLRVNVNGLVRGVSFNINGYEYFDDAAPFTIALDALDDGDNEITIIASDGSGVQTESTFAVKVER